MSFFSRSSSSNKHRYKHGHYGSNHYKKKGLLDGILNILNSSSRSHKKYKEPRQYFDETVYKQNTNGSTVCPRCKSANAYGAKFCNSCGEKIQNKSCCSNCGKSLSPNDSFCSNCGQKS